MSDNPCCYEREPTLTLLFPLNFGLLSCKAQCLRKKTATGGAREYWVKESKRSESVVQRNMQTQWTAQHEATSHEAFLRPAVLSRSSSFQALLPSRPPGPSSSTGSPREGALGARNTVRGAQRPESSPLLRLSKDPLPNCPIATRSLKMNIRKIKQQQQNTTSFSTVSTFKNFIIL